MKGNKKFEIFKRTKNKFNLLNDLSKNFKIQTQQKSKTTFC